MNALAKALKNAKFDLTVIQDNDGSIYVQLDCTIEGETLVLAQTRAQAPVKKAEKPQPETRIAPFAGFVASKRDGNVVIEAIKDEADGLWYAYKKTYRDGRDPVVIKAAVGRRRKKRALLYFEENGG